MRVFSLVVVGIVLLDTTASLGRFPAQAAGSQQDRFEIAKGDGYEGALIPGTSPWNKLFAEMVTRGGPDASSPSQLVGWTPTAPDVALAERELKALIDQITKEPKTVASLALPDSDKAGLQIGISWLASNLTKLARQYTGVKAGSVRRIIVHGIPDSSTRPWRTEGVMMMGGGCGNFWFYFDLDGKRVLRFICGGFSPQV